MTSGDSNLLRQAAALPKQIEPERDLWPLIEAELNEMDAVAGPVETPVETPVEKRASRVPPWQTGLAMAAGLLLAVSVGFWLGNGSRVLPDGQGFADTHSSQSSSPGTRPVNQTMTAALPMTAELRRTRVALSDEIEAALDGLPEDARVVVRENLATINQALEEIDQVLGQAPESALDQQLLMTMYADQLALLGSMQRLVRTSNSDKNQEILL